MVAGNEFSFQTPKAQTRKEKSSKEKHTNGQIGNKQACNMMEHAVNAMSNGKKEKLKKSILFQNKSCNALTE